MTKRRAIWVIPSLHTEGDEGIERRVTWLELTLERYVDEPTHPRLSPGIKVLVGLAAVMATGLPLANPTVLLIVLLFSLAIPAGYGAWVWFTQPAQVPTPGREETEQALG